MNWSYYYKRIPATVTIGKSLYRIFWVDEYPKDDRQVGETNFNGEKFISIKIHQSKKEAVSTYWHEILHAISNEWNVNLTEKQVIELENCLPFILKKGNMFSGEKNGKIQRNKANKRKRRNS